MIKKYIR